MPRSLLDATVSIAITTGEPAGIGPEISVKALQQFLQRNPAPAAHITLIGNAVLLQTQLAACALPYMSDSYRILDCALATPVQAGSLDVRNAAYVLQTLDRAIAGALKKISVKKNNSLLNFDAIVTAPVQKSIINQAGFAFTGHTEYLAEKTHTKQVVMMLSGATTMQPLRVALATTHLPLSAVPGAITQAKLINILRIIDADLKTKFGIPAPRILVTGLNPHAGEEGILGREEIEIIKPAIEAACAQGMNVSGPYPADTLFQEKYLQQADCVLAMYHDQGLPVLKYATFGHGINITLGLPIIRTSVDHGTALDLAGKNCAHAGSMLAAIETAVHMAHRAAART